MKKGQLSKSRTFDEARNAIIERKLILKAAADAKMSLQSWVVDNRIKEITQSAFGGDRSKLLAALASEGIKYTDWEKRVREDMIVSAMSWNAVYKNVVATPAEMKAEYENNKSRYTKGGKVTISVILLKPSDAGKKEEITEALKTQSFADLARRYGMCASGFGRKFREVTGIPPLKYCRLLRLEQVREELLTSSIPVEVLAEKYGFTDSNHLIKLFKKRYGMTPLAFRRTI
jgi:AraC-like DNA-binding protein